jgi:hypothetical protein
MGTLGEAARTSVGPTLDTVFVNGDSIHDPDSIAADRNRMIIGGAIWGTFHEVIAAVDTLQKAALTRVLKEGADKLALASWKTIRTMAHRWRGDIETKARTNLHSTSAMRTSCEQASPRGRAMNR